MASVLPVSALQVREEGVSIVHTEETAVPHGIVSPRRVSGRAAATVIIANHTCFVDPVFLFYAYGPAAVVRIETKETPIVRGPFPHRVARAR